MDAPEDSLPHLKSVSKIKHAILAHYLPPWAAILGGKHLRLNYIDCFAGPGMYESGGKPHEGSPLIAVRAAKDFLAKNPRHQLNLVFAERDDEARARLEPQTRTLAPFPSGLRVQIIAEDSAEFVPRLLADAKGLAPSFFFIDPYGHPLALPIIRSILVEPRAEVLVNLMWYSMNMHLNNPEAESALHRLFGNNRWQQQPFMTQSGATREHNFLDYFTSQLGAKFVLPFRIGFDPEDKVHSERTKYYLLHASNHVRAALLMKEVMWPLGDEAGTFDASGSQQGILISMQPKESELRDILLREFAGQTVTFDRIVESTWQLPFIPKTYRAVLKRLRTDGTVSVQPVTSKADGLSGHDCVTFPPLP